MAGLIGGGLLYRHFAQDVDSRGATRLMRAIEENDMDKAVKLLSTGDVNVRDKSGQTALFYAARHATEPKVIYKLIVAGADTLATDKSGNTALTTAAKYNPSAVIVMTLAKQGRQNEEQQANKNRALVKAVKYNSAEVIKTLLIAQASPVSQELDGKNVAAYLAENEKLTEQEKTDYRQIMLMLEILEGRERFAATVKGRHSQDSKTLTEKVKEVFSKKETVEQKSVSADVPAEPKPEQAPAAEKLVPQEKQMSAEKK